MNNANLKTEPGVGQKKSQALTALGYTKDPDLKNKTKKYV